MQLIDIGKQKHVGFLKECWVNGMKKQTETNIKYGIIGFVLMGLSFGGVGGYFLYYSLVNSNDIFVALISEKAKLEISTKFGLFLFILFGIIGTLLALTDAPIVEDEV